MWTLFWAIATTLSVDALGIRNIQPVIWPTDIYSFERTPEAEIDVAIYGSSRASLDLSPSGLDACLSDGLDRETTSVNLGRSFATGFSTHNLLTSLFEKRTPPKVIILGIGPEFLDETNHRLHLDVGFNSDLDDVPRQLLQSRSISLAFGALRPIVRGAESLAIFTAQRHTKEERLRWMMIHHGGGQYCVGSKACEIQNNSHDSALVGRWDQHLASNVVTAEAERFSEYVTDGPLVGGGLDKFLKWAAEKDIQVGVVVLPFHELYKRQIPMEVRRAFRGKLSALSETYGLRVYDVGAQGWGQKRALYLDTDHLNATGSAQLTQDVCEKLALPMLSGKGR